MSVLAQLRHALSVHPKSIRHASGPNSLPVIESCPSPTCLCGEVPPGLDIDRNTPLNGTAPRYAEQLVLSTGHSNWPSRIEDDDAESAVPKLRRFLGRDAKFHDPYHQIMITNSSLPAPADEKAGESASGFVFPSFKYVPHIPLNNQDLEAFIKGFLLPTELHASYNGLAPAEQSLLRRAPEMQRRFRGVRNVDEILVLICGHGSRDERCGLLGPLLVDEFKDKLSRQNVDIVPDPPPMHAPAVLNPSPRHYRPSARVGLISHIGGHKFAGNVITYIPPGFAQNSLAGKGIWYGRVEPRHVEGIVAQTILGGRVIKELFRGGVDRDGTSLRL